MKNILTSDANDSLFISPPLIPLIRPGIPIVECWQPLKENCNIKVYILTEMNKRHTFILHLSAVVFFNQFVGIESC